MNIQTFQPQIIPLTQWEDGTIRVGGTRVLLDIVVHEFNEGRTPEEIVISYPTLKLAEVYGVITYYLDNRDQIEAYLAQRQQETEGLWQKIESNPHQKALREKLLAYRTSSG